MKIRNLATALVVMTSTALAATAAPVQAAHDDGSAARTGNRSLASVLAADGNSFDHNWSDFDIVHRAVSTVLAAKPDSDVAVLAQGRQRVTAFLPTDRAFRVLVEDLTGNHKRTERAVFATVARSFDVNTIEAVLLYHVVPGATVDYAQARRSDGARLPTALDGAPVTVRVVDGKVKLRDLDRNDANARVIKAARNINKGNKQIAHGISRVLRPVDL
jgi:uncharacterized surface protein with fasciclin (FAS1) repeats